MTEEEEGLADALQNLGEGSSEQAFEDILTNPLLMKMLEQVRKEEKELADAKLSKKTKSVPHHRKQKVTAKSQT